MKMQPSCCSSCPQESQKFSWRYLQPSTNFVQFLLSQQVFLRDILLLLQIFPVYVICSSVELVFHETFIWICDGSPCMKYVSDRNTPHTNIIRIMTLAVLHAYHKLYDQQCGNKQERNFVWGARDATWSAEATGVKIMVVQLTEFQLCSVLTGI